MHRSLRRVGYCPLGNPPWSVGALQFRAVKGVFLRGFTHFSDYDPQLKRHSFAYSAPFRGQFYVYAGIRFVEMTSNFVVSVRKRAGIGREVGHFDSLSIGRRR